MSERKEWNCMGQPERGDVNDLARYRLETAKSDLQSANILIREKEYRGANNRAYYAIYHAISAVHALGEKLHWQRRSVMPVIMMIFILQQKRRPRSRF